MPDRTTRKSPLVPLVVTALAALALVVALVGLPGGGDDTTATGNNTGSSADNGSGSSTGSSDENSDKSGSGSDAGNPLEQLARRQADDPMAMGDVDAPVVLIAYSEFQCPFCGKFARDTAPTLEEEYVEDGTLRIEWRDFPYLGPESTTAALAGRAAAAQGEFWAFHDALYENQLPPNSGNLDEDYVAGIAEEVGLDVDRFRRDLDSEKIREQVSTDFQEGQTIGVTGTPSFLVNGTPIVGAQPTEVFEQAIRDAAAAS